MPKPRNKKLKIGDKVLYSRNRKGVVTGEWLSDKLAVQLDGDPKGSVTLIRERHLRPQNKFTWPCETGDCYNNASGIYCPNPCPHGDGPMGC